jgi:UDPglucose 6-dehydrogenase
VNVGVVGCGVVGGAVADNLERYGHTVSRRDPDKGFNDDLKGNDAIFICVWDDGYGHNLEYVVSQLAGLDSVLIIKTTALPGTTDKLAKKYGSGRIVYQPEFLCEDTARQDFADQPYAVIGSWDYYSIGVTVSLLSPFVGRFLIMNPTQAEITKLATNTLFAVTVTYANEVADLCDEYGVDYAEVRDALYTNPMTCSNHLDVHHKGYRGYGGKCLPKDVIMFHRAGHAVCYQTKLADTVHEMNEIRVNRDYRRVNNL